MPRQIFSPGLFGVRVLRTAMISHSSRKPLLAFYSFCCLVLIAMNLRPGIVVLGPVLDEVRLALNLSASQAGFLTTLPLLCFGFLSLLTPRLAAKAGLNRALIICMGILLIGLILRAVPPYGVMLAGTFLMGTGIAFGNVLVPTLVKRDYPAHTGVMMGTYTLCIGLGAGLGALSAVPVMQAMDDWRFSLWLWAGFAAVALTFSLPLWFRQDTSRDGQIARLSLIIRSPLAWAVTIMMGMQSLGFYTLQAWLAVMLADQGMSAERAGNLLSLMNMLGIPASFIMPMLATRMANQRLLVLATLAVMLTGLTGLTFSPQNHTLLWIILVGLTQGAALSLCLICVLLRSRNMYTAGLLSAMSQSIGYLLAAAGPVFFAHLHEWQQNWQAPMLMVLASIIVMALVSWWSAADQEINVGDD